MPKNLTEQDLDRRFDDFGKHFDITIDAFRSENATRFDELATILKRLDQERVFTIEWVRRLESDVNLLKGHLHLA